MAIHFDNVLLETDLTTSEEVDNGTRYEPRPSRERRRIRKERLNRKCETSKLLIGVGESVKLTR